MSPEVEYRYNPPKADTSDVLRLAEMVASFKTIEMEKTFVELLMRAMNPPMILRTREAK